MVSPTISKNNQASWHKDALFHWSLEIRDSTSFVLRWSNWVPKLEITHLSWGPRSDPQEGTLGKRIKINQKIQTAHKEPVLYRSHASFVAAALLSTDDPRQILYYWKHSSYIRGLTLQTITVKRICKYEPHKMAYQSLETLETGKGKELAFAEESSNCWSKGGEDLLSKLYLPLTLTVHMTFKC